MDSTGGASLFSIVCVIAFTLVCVTAPLHAQVAVERGVMRTRMGNVTFEAPPAGPVSASVPQSLDFGNRLRTADLSWAVVEFADMSRIKVRELSLLEIVKPSTLSTRPGLRIVRGAIYVADLPRFRDFRVETPTAKIAPEGTEFLIEVTDEGTRVVMFDGRAALESQQGMVTVSAGEQGTVGADGRAIVSRIEAKNLVQWWLYYPAVLNPSELQLNPEPESALDRSLKLYRAGSPTEALQSFPGYPASVPRNEAEKLYYAGLLLAAGGIDKAQAQLVNLESPLASALRTLIFAVQGTNSAEHTETVPASASEWLAQSYLHQSRHELEASLAAAKRALDLSPDFAFASARVAELEFSFGRVKEARAALRRSLELAPRLAQNHALNGFILSAGNEPRDALVAFDEAIRLDPGLGNAWLGRGLSRLRVGERKAGLEDIQMAAVLEPNRSLLHSYLGKAFGDEGERRAALKELEFARTLDPKDPTPLLYSALIHRDERRINSAVDDLESSIDLNDNRAVYRSNLLLDQDRAVRGANLAHIYRDAGMNDVSVREAVRAVETDYANFSAHLFLANSYSDRLNYNPQVNLRYETPRVSEYLIASMLAPASAGVLSPTVSQQEYSRLFDKDRFGFSSTTEYLSRGAWSESAAHNGVIGDLGYAVDAYYISDPGQHSNNDLELKSFSARAKYDLTLQDSIFIQAVHSDSEFGDLAQYYDPANPTNGANRLVRGEEEQSPIVLAGYHRQWSHGSHTLLLVGRLEDTLRVENPVQSTLVLRRDGPGEPVASVLPFITSQRYESELELYSAEAQQIFQSDRHAFILGGRYQGGRFETENTNTILANYTNAAGGILPPILFNNPRQNIESDFERLTGYGYAHWQVSDLLRLIGGAAYDHMKYPANFRFAPVSDETETVDLLAPKAGLILTPFNSTVMRAGFSRSLGGAGIDQSFRLEPTHVAGFNQSWRSLAPESVTGANSAEEFETWGLSLEHKFPWRLYAGVSGDWLNSHISREFGVFDRTNAPAPGYIFPSGIRERMDFSERTLTFTLNQLAGECWAFGSQYRVSRAELDQEFPGIPETATFFGGFRPSQELRATLHQVRLFAMFNHPGGLFVQGDSLWSSQSNNGYNPDLPGDEFWQFNLQCGYRFPRRGAEVRIGLLNVTDEDYRLNPLNLTSELPRERTFAASLRVAF